MTKRDEHLDEETIWRALETFEPGAEERAPRAAGSADAEEGETLLRLHRELWGLLPYELEPVTPSETSRRRILAAIRGESRTDAASGPAPPARPEEPLPRRRLSGFTLLAASVALAALGLAGWLALELSQKEAALAQFEAALEAPAAGEADLSEVAADLQALHEQVATLRASMAIFTSPRVEICPLRPTGPEPAQPEARGLIYFDPTQGRWLVAAEGLEPAPAGQVYRLWFLVNDTPHHAGHFTVHPGVPVHFTDSSLLEGMQAVAITLEPVDEEVAAPTGPTILYGTEEEMIRPFEV